MASRVSTTAVRSGVGRGRAPGLPATRCGRRRGNRGGNPGVDAHEEAAPLTARDAACLGSASALAGAAGAAGSAETFP